MNHMLGFLETCCRDSFIHCLCIARCPLAIIQLERGGGCHRGNGRGWGLNKERSSGSENVGYWNYKCPFNSHGDGSLVLQFLGLCQDICEIKSNNYLEMINMQKMTITPTQLESTSYLDNHKPHVCNKSEGDDQGDTCSPYKPSLEMTMGCNSDN